MDKVSQCLKVPKVLRSLKGLKVPKCVQESESPGQAWALPFKGSSMFTLTSMVISSIIMEVIHMYISIAMKLF